MRRIALIALIAGVAVAVMATPAFAINSILKLDVRISPTKVGTKQKPQAITLFTRPYYDTLEPDADAPFAWKQARVFFPKEGVFNGKYFPSCPATKLTSPEGRASCKKAEIGKVDAKGFALGLVEPLKVKLYNLPGGKGVALYLQGDNPVIIDHVVTGILTRINDPLFGYKLTFDVPPDLIQPAPGAYADGARLQGHRAGEDDQAQGQEDPVHRHHRLPGERHLHGEVRDGQHRRHDDGGHGHRSLQEVTGTAERGGSGRASGPAPYRSGACPRRRPAASSRRRDDPRARRPLVPRAPLPGARDRDLDRALAQRRARGPRARARTGGRTRATSPIASDPAATDGGGGAQAGTPARCSRSSASTSCWTPSDVSLSTGKPIR